MHGTKALTTAPLMSTVVPPQRSVGCVTPTPSPIGIVQQQECWVRQTCCDLRSDAEGFKTLSLVLREFESEADVDAFVAALERNTNLERLYLGGCFARNPRWLVRVVRRAIASHPSLREVALNGNNLDLVVAAAVGLALATNDDSKIERLLLNDNKGIGDLGARALSCGLVRNRRLKVLNLSGCGIASGGARAIAEALKKDDTNDRSSSLEVLILNRNRIGVEGCRALSSALVEAGKNVRGPRSSSLKELHLMANGLGYTAARALVEAGGISRRVDSSLEVLALAQNHLKDKGCMIVASALAGSSSVKRLYLGDNSIGDQGALALARCCQGTQNDSGTALEALDLSHNKISRHACLAVAQALREQGVDDYCLDGNRNDNRGDDDSDDDSST